MKPEHRIKVLDLSTHWSGSVASRHLGHLGADVVKLENPKIGDGNRSLAPMIAGEGMSHIALNGGKRSVALDRHAKDWNERFAECVRWADVIIIGSQPGVARKRGQDFESIVRLNDCIVYCNISGYGEIGPWSNYPLHGLNGDIVAGLVPVEMVDGFPVPRSDYRSVGTTLAGIEAAIGILEALRRRDLGYGAQQVATSIWESAMFWQWRDLTTMVNTGHSATAYANLGSRYAIYMTGDDRMILICPIEKKFWEVFCDIARLPPEWKLVGDWTKSGMDWGYGRQSERALIGERMAERTLAEWQSVLAAADIPFSPLISVAEAADTDHASAVGVTAVMSVNGEAVRVPNIPIHIVSAERRPEDLRGPAVVSSSPQLGEHTQSFLKEVREPH